MMRKRITLWECFQNIVSQIENGDFDCEISSIGTGYHGDDYFYFIELKNGKEIKIPVYK